MAGAAIAGFLLGRPTAHWLDASSFVISKDTGEQYVVLRGGDDPVIQRVPNYVSAQLLLGEPEPDALPRCATSTSARSGSARTSASRAPRPACRAEH